MGERLPTNLYSIVSKLSCCFGSETHINEDKSEKEISTEYTDVISWITFKANFLREKQQIE